MVCMAGFASDLPRQGRRSHLYSPQGATSRAMVLVCLSAQGRQAAQGLSGEIRAVDMGTAGARDTAALPTGTYTQEIPCFFLFCQTENPVVESLIMVRP